MATAMAALGDGLCPRRPMRSWFSSRPQGEPRMGGDVNRKVVNGWIIFHFRENRLRDLAAKGII